KVSGRIHRIFSDPVCFKSEKVCVCRDGYFLPCIRGRFSRDRNLRISREEDQKEKGKGSKGFNQNTTALGTKAEASPPLRMISRATVSFIAAYRGSHRQKTVSTSGARDRFIWARGVSYSKSLELRSPRIMNRLFCSRHIFTV